MLKHALLSRLQSWEPSLFVLVCLLCGLPVWLAHFPPMVDLPQHAAQVGLFFNLQHPDFAYRNLFDINWFTPNLTGYLLIGLLTPMVGVLWACKWVISIALIAFPLSVRYFLRRAGADPFWAWLAIPIGYGFSYQWGFVNFIVAAPLGMVFLGLVYGNNSRHSWRTGLMMSGLLYLLFFSHVLILALFGTLAALHWLTDSRSIRDFWNRAWPLLTPLPVVILWLWQAGEHQMSHFPIEWDLSWFSTTDGYYNTLAEWLDSDSPGWGRVNGFIPRLLGERGGALITLFGLALFVLPLLAGARLVCTWKRIMPFALLSIILLCVPTLVFGVNFVFQRFTFLAIPFYLLMFNYSDETKPSQRWISAVAPLLALLWLGHSTLNAQQFNRDSAGLQEIIAQMEPEKRALAMMLKHEDSFSIAPTFTHMVSWYAALKRGVVDPSFAVTQVQPVAYYPDAVPKARTQGFEWFPQQFDWKLHNGILYNYFLVHSKEDYGAYLFKTAQCRITLKMQNGMWWLYERTPYCRAG